MATKILLVLLALSFSFVHAQEIREQPKHPGETIKFEIKFDGKDADKVKKIMLHLSTNAPETAEQPSFTDNFNDGDGWVLPSGDGKTFHAKITIPDNARNGVYTLHVEANAEPGAASYVGGVDFKLPTYRIDNPKTFKKPGISVQEQH